MNYYLIKARIIKNLNPLIEDQYLIETDFNIINLYSAGNVYNKINDVDEIIFNNNHYNLDSLKNYCYQLIPLDSITKKEIQLNI
jgi:hypothetical protein